jgi:hypothetical protein
VELPIKPNSSDIAQRTVTANGKRLGQGEASLELMVLALQDHVLDQQRSREAPNCRVKDFSAHCKIPCRKCNADYPFAKESCFLFGFPDRSRL